MRTKLSASYEIAMEGTKVLPDDTPWLNISPSYFLTTALQVFCSTVENFHLQQNWTYQAP